MADTASLSATDIIAIVTPILVMILIISQLLDRRDKKSKDLTDPIGELKQFIRDEFHKGELSMQEMKSDIRINRYNIKRLEEEQAAIRTDSGKILDNLSVALKSNSVRKKRRADESDDGA